MGEELRGHKVRKTLEVRSKSHATKTQSHEASQKVTKSKYVSLCLGDFVAKGYIDLMEKRLSVKPMQFSKFIEAVKRLEVFWAIVNEPPLRSIRKGTIRKEVP